MNFRPSRSRHVIGPLSCPVCELSYNGGEDQNTPSTPGMKSRSVIFSCIVTIIETNVSKGLSVPGELKIDEEGEGLSVPWELKSR